VYTNGHILYGRAQTTGTIWAAPFSLESRSVTGPSFLVAESGDVPSVSQDGTLVYAAGTFVGFRQLVWVDRAGKVTEVIGRPQQGLQTPVVAPDGSKAAVEATESGAWQIWIHDLERGTRRPFSREKGAIYLSDWITDDLLAYTIGGETYLRSVTGAEPPQLLLESDRGTRTAISSDLRYAAIERRVNESLDIFYFDLKHGGGALPLLVSAATEAWPAIRPGGDWLAYVSNESGRDEVYLVEFPSGRNKRQVSVNGGTSPRWSGKGEELFYENDYLMLVRVTTEPELKLAEPERLFGGADATISIGGGWSVSSDGQRILVARAVTTGSGTGRITVVENWYREFESR